MGDVKITYETLFELLRREKSREELQKLDNDFFSDIIGYLENKKNKIGELKNKNDLFVHEEIRIAEAQEFNIRKIIKSLYELREKKIINMAIDCSREQCMIDTSPMLKEEQILFENIKSMLSQLRSGILYNLLECRMPEIKDIELDNEQENTEKEEKKNDSKMVRFVSVVPKFIGEDMKEYGPFESEDVANLPNSVADILIKKEQAEEMK